MAARRVVITGLGAISPLGLTTDELWEGICTGKSGIAEITAFDPSEFPCKIAGEVPPYKIRDFIPKSYRKATKLMCRDIELSIVAADEAVKSSGLVTKGIDEDNVNVEPSRFAINIGAGLISCELEELSPATMASIVDGKFDIRKWGTDGIPQVTPLWLLKYLPNMLACHVGIIHDIQGPSNTITCAEASAILAISEAKDVIERGCCDLALAGGAEAKVNPIVMLRQSLLKRAVENGLESPETASRPFDTDAKGGVFGEAAGVIILEEYSRATDRDADIFAEVAGTGSSVSLNSKYEFLEKDGKGIQYAIESALSDAGINPEELDLIIPHGLGEPENDKAEAMGIKAALGDAVKTVLVLPTKSMISNTGAASGAIDVIIGAKCIKEGKIPAAKNFNSPIAGCELNINKSMIKKEVNYVLCCSYTFGGQISAIVLKKPEVK